MKKKFLAGMILAAGIFTGCGSDLPPPPPPKAETAETNQTASKQLAEKSAAELKDKQELKRYILAIQPYLDNVRAKWQEPDKSNTVDFSELSKAERTALIFKNIQLMEHNANLHGAMIQEIGKIDTPKAAEELKNTLVELNACYFKNIREYMDYFSGSEEERHTLSGTVSSLIKIATASSSSEIDRLIRKRDQIIDSVRDVEVDAADIHEPEKIIDSVFENQPPKSENTSAEGEAVSAFKSFHENITEKDFLRAFERFSVERRNKIRLEDWINGFKTTVSSKVSDIRVKSHDGDSVVLDYVLTTEDNPGGVRHFNGTATLIFESGEWKIDSAHNTLIND